jgi:hypothetical protein
VAAKEVLEHLLAALRSAVKQLGRSAELSLGHRLPAQA